MSQAADSAGVPFEGREFQPHPFAGDTGQTPDSLAAALDYWHRTRSAEAFTAVVDALRHDRILVPLIAEAGDFGQSAEGLVVEKTQELSVVTVEGPGGEPVGLVFSDVESMQSWRAKARPQPAEAARAAAWALEEGISRLVLNPTASDECVVRRGALVALVTGEPYVAPWEDEVVAEAIASAVSEGAVHVRSGWDLLGGNGPDLVVDIALPAGRSAEDLAVLQQRWAEAWAGSDVISRRVDGMHLSIVPAG